jgi:hypothetical protein
VEGGSELILVIICFLIFIASILYAFGPMVVECLLDATDEWRDVIKRIREMGSDEEA